MCILSADAEFIHKIWGVVVICQDEYRPGMWNVHEVLLIWSESLLCWEADICVIIIAASFVKICHEQSFWSQHKLCNVCHNINCNVVLFFLCIRDECGVYPHYRLRLSFTIYELLLSLAASVPLCILLSLSILLSIIQMLSLYRSLDTV